MNNEERILSMLEQLTLDVSGLKADVSGLKTDVSVLKTNQKRLEEKFDALTEKVDVIYDQTALLTEFKTEITHKIDDLLIVTKENTFDITRLKAVH